MISQDNLTTLIPAAGSIISACNYNLAFNDPGTLNIGSSLKFCIVAEGKADVYPRFGPTMEWDTGAPQVIAEESGAAVYIAEGLDYGKRI